MTLLSSNVVITPYRSPGRSERGVRELVLSKRALLAMGTRYQVVHLGGAPTILKRWRCANDGAVIASEDEYGRHTYIHPDHRIVVDTS